MEAAIGRTAMETDNNTVISRALAPANLAPLTVTWRTAPANCHDHCNRSGLNGKRNSDREQSQKSHLRFEKDRRGERNRVTHKLWHQPRGAERQLAWLVDRTESFIIALAFWHVNPFGPRENN